MEPAMLLATLLMAATAVSVHTLDISQCIAPLGMESGLIPDKDITASSCYNDGNVAPHNGRLNVERLGGAWCPRTQISVDAAEWLQVDLHSVHVITAVATQGRFGNGQGQEFAEAYVIEYWRPRLGKWVRYRNNRGEEILSGNTNTYLETKNQLSPAVWASKLRFIPHSSHRRTVCMRVEIYGCLWNTGIVSYSMPAGDTRGNGVELSDATYDGSWSGGELRGGLGQLVDGHYGGDEIREASRVSAWVGWRNDTRGPPALTFEFDRVREFTAVHVHCNNKFMRDVRVFSEAVVRFSVGGRHYQDGAVQYHYSSDDIFESARNVTMALHRRIARYVRIEFHFAARWILVSEIVFDSEPAQGNHSVERARPAPGASAGPGSGAGASAGAGSGRKRGQSTGGAPVPTTRREDPLYVAVVVGVLTALAILLGVAVFLLVHRHRHRKCFTSPLAKTTASSETRRPFDDYSTCAGSMTACEKAAVAGTACCEYQEPYEALNCVPYLTGCGSAATVLLEMKQLHSELPTLSNEESSNYDYALPEPSSMPLLVDRPHSLSSPCIDEYTREFSSAGEVFGECGRGGEDSEECERGDDDLEKCGRGDEDSEECGRGDEDSEESGREGDDSAKRRRRGDDSAKRRRGGEDSAKRRRGGEDSAKRRRRGEDSAKRRREAGTVGCAVPEISVHRLRLISKLAEGAFGMVYVAEGERVPEYLGGICSERSLVAVKFLSLEANDHERAAFQRDVRVLAALAHPTLARVLASCRQPDALVLEYLEGGDLCAQIRKAQPPQRTLLHVAEQLAAGVAYLESLNFVHRDLAARNCVVGAGYQIKIGDFGTDNETYARDYVHLSGRAVPLRWAAPEAALEGQYSTRTDVWSLAVTLHEVFSWCRRRPYATLSDEQVLCNLRALSVGARWDALERVATCPRDLHDALVSCWRREPRARPTARDIHEIVMRVSLTHSPS